MEGRGAARTAHSTTYMLFTLILLPACLAAGTRILLDQDGSDKKQTNLVHEPTWSQHAQLKSWLQPDDSLPHESYYLPNGKDGRRLSYYPECPGYNVSPTAVIDITEALQTHDELRYACVFNPSLALLPDGKHSILAYRAWMHDFPLEPCPKPGEDLDRKGHPWKASWSGQGGWGLVVLEIPLSADGRWLDGPMITKSNMVVWSKGQWEDLRISYDAIGQLRIFFTVMHGWDAQPHRNTMHTAKVDVQQQGDTWTISVLPETELKYLDAEYGEKNWVHWNGTNMITYPHYPEGLSPHRVFEFPDFDSEDPAIFFKHATMDAFFPRFKALYRPWIRFSGGTPAVLLPGGTEFLAVGHALGNNNCFHKPLDGHSGAAEEAESGLEGEEEEGEEAAEEEAGLDSPMRHSRNRNRNLLVAEADVASRKSATGQGQQQPGQQRQGSAGQHSRSRRALLEEAGGDGNGQEGHKKVKWLYEHGCKNAQDHKQFESDWLMPGKAHYRTHDYLQFFYTFSAQAPHQLTGISHAFVLYDAPLHHGVQFPAGLTITKQGFLLLSYGQDDYRAMLAVWPLAAVRRLVVPLGQIDPQQFQFCHLGKDVPRTRVVADAPVRE